jgi:hypothetical protein
MKMAIVLLTALGAGCLDDIIPGTKPPCMESAEKSMSIEVPADPATTFQIESCMADQDACTGLCSLLLQRNMIDGTATSCDVKFGDTRIDVTVHYKHMRADAEDCPFNPPDGGVIVGAGGGSGI